MARGRKPTGRTIPIYPRVNQKNREWLTKMTNGLDISESEFLDKVLTFVRTDVGVKNVKEMVLGSKA